MLELCSSYPSSPDLLSESLDQVHTEAPSLGWGHREMQERMSRKQGRNGPSSGHTKGKLSFEDVVASSAPELVRVSLLPPPLVPPSQFVFRCVSSAFTLGLVFASPTFPSPRLVAFPPRTQRFTLLKSQKEPAIPQTLSCFSFVDIQYRASEIARPVLSRRIEGHRAPERQPWTPHFDSPHTPRTQSQHRSHLSRQLSPKPEQHTPRRELPREKMPQPDQPVPPPPPRAARRDPASLRESTRYLCARKPESTRQPPQL